MKTTKSIYEEMLAHFELNSGNKPYGVIAPILGALSTQLTNVYAKLQYMQDNMFLHSADEESLHKHMAYELSKREAQLAKGKIVITGSVDSLNFKIPYNTLLEDNEGLTYTTKDEVFPAAPINLYQGELGAEIKHNPEKEEFMYIDNLRRTDNNYYYPTTPIFFNIRGIDIRRMGYVDINDKEKIYFKKEGLSGIINVGDIVKVYTYRVEVEIRATEGGKQYNKDFGKSLFFRTPIPGIDEEVRVSSEHGITGGEDAETQESYRARALRYKIESRASGSKNSIMEQIYEKFSDIAFIYIKGGGDIGAGPGKIRIYLLDYSYTLDETAGGIKDKVREFVHSIISADVDPNNVTCEAPKVKSVDVIINNLAPSDKELEKHMQTDLEDFFREGVNGAPYFEQNINVNKIRSRLYQTISGSISAQHFNLKYIRVGVKQYNDVLVKEDDTLYKFGALIKE